MSTLKELRDVRLENLKTLRGLGVDPYPAKSSRNITCGKILSEFESFEGKQIVVAGRIISIREHGKIAFIDIKDQSGKVQLYLKQENIKSPDLKYSELGFENLDLLDAGDFVEGTGRVVKTQRGQVSVEVVKLRLLTKTLRPLPDKWEGLKDKETRLRRRYLDTNINEEVFQRFIRRAKFWDAHREFFKQHGFLEINIPVLEMVPGGADAAPFITHMESIDQDFYLRISQELYLKRLVGGGYEKVFEIGPRFRNEGLSDEHLPEHIAMEFYWAYADWQDGMKLIEDLYKYIIDYVYAGRKIFKIRGFEVDFSKKWEIIDFSEIIKKHYDVDVLNPDLEKLKQAIIKNKIKSSGTFNIPRAVDTLWKEIRKTIAGPAFLINHPKYLSPLQ